LQTGKPRADVIPTAAAQASATQAGATQAAPTPASLIADGRAQIAAGDRAAARATFARALALSRTLDDRAGEAAASFQAAQNLFNLNERAESRAAIDRAIALFREAGDQQALAESYAVLVYVLDGGPEQDAARAEGLRIARAAGTRQPECQILHEWGDGLFNRGDFVGAQARLEQAAACFDEVHDLSNVGRVYTSLGRVQRVHGQLAAAIDLYTRGLALQEQATDDQLGIVQNLNAIAVTHQYLGHHEEALKYYERAFAKAEELKATTAIAFLRGQLGGLYVKVGEYAKAIPLLMDSMSMQPRPNYYSHRAAMLAECYAMLGDLPHAQQYADIAVNDASADTGRDLYIVALRVRANVSIKRGDLEGARRDLDEALRLIEAVRQKTLPLDFMKRGYSERVQTVFASTIDLLAREGHWRQALETAEQARARAFLDLLASREAPVAAATANAGAAATTAAAATGAAANSAAATSAKGSGTPSAIASTATAPAETSRQRTLESARTAPPANMAEMIATAKRLQSTLVAYWVGDTATYVWVVSPTGQVHARRIDIVSGRLEMLVSRAAETMTDARGGIALIGRSQMRPWSELYTLLVQPVLPYLPTADNSLLTIVPHGPLFRLSFAALRNERGQYLVERYRLHYTPAIGVLEFTARHAPAGSATPTPTPAQALLIGDPGPLKGIQNGLDLPGLPYAKREVEDIASQLPAGSARVLVDATANESEVRARMPGMDLVHFATHGVVQQQESLQSFLALRSSRDAIAPDLTNDTGSPRPAGVADAAAAGSANSAANEGRPANHKRLATGSVNRGATAAVAGASGAALAAVDAIDAANDGRLTAEEVYSLNLHARLVVLSACGTALGPMTGDGVIGFTRAFLYAGAASVIATEWDVPDAAGYELMRRFYQHRAAAARRTARVSVAIESTALRQAQLDVIQALRKGTLKVEAPGGAVALPEHPMLWAGFVVVGEP
jgi:CHAT domain-containing protein